MRSLYIGSTETFCGKSAFAFGIALAGKDRGLCVGYMKPVAMAVSEAGSAGVDEDAEFARRVLDLEESLDIIAPVSPCRSDVEQILEGKLERDYRQVLTDAYGRLSSGKDLVLLEGGGNLREGYTVGLPAQTLLEMLDAKALVVVPHSVHMLTDDALAVQAALGDRLLGVVINRVPRYRMRFAEQVVCSYLEGRGVRVYGVLPEERLLQAVSVREIADRLDGEVLCAEDSLDELVENLMVGAMSVESALSYFRRLPNKAVITGGDRPDVQLAALETSTRAIVLTGNLRPSAIILSRAEEVGVPMVMVRPDTMTTVEALSSFFGHSRFHQPKKIERFGELLAERFDLDGLLSDLGV